MPHRLSMMCSKRNCSYWRHCEREWGGEVPQSCPLPRLYSHTTLLGVGSTRDIEASHTGADSHHRLGPRKFSEKHNLNIPAIVRRQGLAGCKRWLRVPNENTTAVLVYP